MKEEMLDFFLSDQISTDIFIFFAEKSVLQGSYVDVRSIIVYFTPITPLSSLFSHKNFPAIIIFALSS